MAEQDKADDPGAIRHKQIEQQMRAASLRRLLAVVDKDPERTLTIIRNWMAQQDG